MAPIFRFSTIWLVVSLLVYSSGALAGQQVDLLWEAGSLEGRDGGTWMGLTDAIQAHGLVVALDLALPTARRFSLEGEYLGDGRDDRR